MSLETTRDENAGKEGSGMTVTEGGGPAVLSERCVRSALPVRGAGCRLSWISAIRTHNKKPSANAHNMSRR
jgi:hypothetical protein